MLIWIYHPTIRIQKTMSILDPSMEDLPVPVMIDILSRLPVKTINHCKSVCKKWLELLSDSYFSNLHLSRSPASLMIHHISEHYYQQPSDFIPGTLKWLEVENELDHHQLHHDPVMSLDLNLSPFFRESQLFPAGSVNGLICLWQFGPEHDNTYICNPITREYMILSRQQYYRQGYTSVIVYCFGVCSVTKEYKVIRIFQGDIPSPSFSVSRPSLLEAEVYTLGTAQWRSLGRVPYWLKGKHVPFLNGHAHWTVIDEDSPEKICAFNFDKETFDLFPSPSSEAQNESLGVLNGCLCRCDTYGYKLTIWVMKEYGVKKSWRKELVIERTISRDFEFLTMNTVHIIKGLKDGTILMASYKDVLFVVCPQTKTAVDTEVFGGSFNGFAYRPSFHRLRNFGNERVYVF